MVTEERESVAVLHTINSKSKGKVASAVEAALSSPPAGPRTSISSKLSGEDKVVQSIQGHKDHSNTIAKSSMSTETEVSHIQHCPFIGNINYQTHISTQIFYFQRLRRRRLARVIVLMGREIPSLLTRKKLQPRQRK